MSSREGARVEVGDAEPIVPIQNDDGLTMWDGKRWRLVAKDCLLKPNWGLNPVSCLCIFDGAL